MQRCSFIWADDDSPTPCYVAVERARNNGSLVISGFYCHNLPFGLTVRELDVLTLVAIGKSNIEIASRLNLSARTVTTHVDHIMGKMSVRSRTAAAVIAVDGGLLKVPFPGGDDGFDLLELGRAFGGTATRRVVRQPRVVKKPFAFGAVLPLHGLAAADGAEMLRGGRLAIDELNRRGGVDGRQLVMEIADVDILDAESVRRGLIALAERDVDVLTSGYFAQQDLAHEIVANWGVPYLHAATMRMMEERVCSDPRRYQNIFQVCASDAHYAPRFVGVLTGLRDTGGWLPSSNRLVVIQGAWDLTDLGVVQAYALAERHGWQIDVIRIFGDDHDSWASLADRIRHGEPAAVMIGNYHVSGTVSFIDSFLADPSDTLVYALYSPSIPEFREQLGERSEGIVWATVTGTYSDAPARAFAGRYRKRFGVSPGRSHAGLAYDRVQLAATALSLAANPRSSRAVADELRVVIHRGVNGTYYFGNESQTAWTYPSPGVDPSLAQAHLIFQIQDGRQRIIDPSPFADARFRPQSWLARSRQAD
ncbi:LuxR C-terminal-related transcriptional regulator [Leekyejoonella antrihumi]|uniref:LuxR C-terminal-related transcriptional regulator n=1 Tax=Leekyejoonella antrihumi TaxID=1660198 RepID=UPI001C944416|nr:LuxR C-terminal-related transcriptional regulator [Leekyejoonella antrihumi]